MYPAGYTKLIVVGGYICNSLCDHLNSVEVIDLKNSSNSCYLQDYPKKDSRMTVGLIDGLIKSCGSYSDADRCYDYNPATNSWDESTRLINKRDSPRSSFIDGIWLVSGDESSGSNDVPQTTEMWTGTTFEPGPQLPIEMYSPCQLTINSTHVFFADTYETGSAFLLDWYAQTWTELPPVPVVRGYMSCGVINNPDNGVEVVIAIDGDTDIFNLREEAWWTGPTEIGRTTCRGRVVWCGVVVGVRGT